MMKYNTSYTFANHTPTRTLERAIRKLRFCREVRRVATNFLLFNYIRGFE